MSSKEATGGFALRRGVGVEGPAQYEVAGRELYYSGIWEKVCLNSPVVCYVLICCAVRCCAVLHPPSTCP